MAYSAEINRKNPTCFLFLIDQSASMAESLEDNTTLKVKAQAIAEVINRILANLVIRTTKEDEVRDYYHVGAIGYGGRLCLAFGGPLAGKEIIPISKLAMVPIRIEERIKKISDVYGNLFDQIYKIPIWLEPVASGESQMCGALQYAHKIIKSWLDDNFDSFPPTIINITGGEPADGDPSFFAESLKQLHNADGNVLLFNIYISSRKALPIEFPDSEEGLPDEFSRRLFRMSSFLPRMMLREAQNEGYTVSVHSRGFGFNADLVSLVNFLEIGTRRATGTRALALDEESISQEEPRFDSPRLRHAIENKFPYPISRAVYQLRGLEDWQGEIRQLANVLGIALQHLAVMALSEYLAGPGRDSDFNQKLLTNLKTPVSHGRWAGILRESLTFIKGQPHRKFFTELLELYAPSPGDKASCSLQEMSNELVELRNDLLKRSADSLPSRPKHRLFKNRLMEFLRATAFLKDYPLVSVKATQTKEGIKSHLCHLHMGFHDTFEQVAVQCDLDLDKTKVAVLNPRSGEILYLHPFYVLRECPEAGCGAVHLFRFDKLDKHRAFYVSVGGHRRREEGAGSDLTALLQGAGAASLRKKTKYLCLEALGKWQQLPLGHVVDGRYEIVAHLRRGGMADVYQVKDLQEGNLAAMKLLPFQFLSDRVMVARFRQEASQARNLDHPHITRILDYGEDLVDHYLVMELADGWETAEGKTALDVGELPKPLPVPEVLQIIRQTCDGLDYIHRQAIVHRDLKPGNLLLFSGGRVKLADFGIARSRETVTLTMTGLAMGTPEYMSPEQVEGKRELKPASDIYSLGVVMYELLTGSPPFSRKTPLATAFAHLHEPVVPPRNLNPEIPEALQKIVLACLAKSLNQRVASARKLYELLVAYEQGGTTLIN